jgi:Fic family protein
MTELISRDNCNIGALEGTSRHIPNVDLFVSMYVRKEALLSSQYAKERLKELPICNRLIKETHEVLMENLRGDEKNPGEFRRSQNWIGPAGSTLKDARYIPPNVDDMTEAISNLEKFINGEDKIEPLIIIALIHYQFETIHPFLDGNVTKGIAMVA